MNEFLLLKIEEQGRTPSNMRNLEGCISRPISLSISVPRCGSKGANIFIFRPMHVYLGQLGQFSFAKGGFTSCFNHQEINFSCVL